MIGKRFLILIVICLFQLSAVKGETDTVQPRYTILGLGDSITEGGNDFSSYIYPLWEKLFAGGYMVDFIGPKTLHCRIGELPHAGYSGRTIEYLDAQMDSIYQAHPADIVLIHAGHNHFVEENPIKGMIASYESVIRKIKVINPDAIILMAQVIESGKLPKYSYIPSLNEEIARMVKKMNDPKVILVNQAAGFDWHEHTIADKVHPNAQGAAQMASTWYNALVQVLPTPRQSFCPEIVTYKVIGGDTLKMHIFKPEGWTPDDKRPAIAYFFAGGWVSGTPLQFYRECAYYASKGMVAISVEYRIKYVHGATPDDGVDDAKDAMCWLNTHAGKWGIDTNRIAASGASAGGYLVAAVGVEPEKEGMCYRPGLLILNYPALDKINEIGTDIPPILFLVGSEDPVIPLPAVYTFEENIRKRNGAFELHIFEKAGHPIFYYRKTLDEKFYEVRALTDHFLERHGYLKN